VIILQFQGPFTGPLNPLKTDVSRGPPGLSGGPGPLGPHRNSTAAVLKLIETDAIDPPPRTSY